MSSFTSNLILEVIPGLKNKRVYKPFRYFPIEKHVGPAIPVEAGQMTDGGSFKWYIEPVAGSQWDNDALAAYVVHDRNYRHLGWIQISMSDLAILEYYNRKHNNRFEIIKRKIDAEGNICIQFSRKACDRMLYDGCLILGKFKWRAKAIYAGVRAFGWYRWRKYKKKLGNRRPT